MTHLRGLPEDPFDHADSDTNALSALLDGCNNPGVNRRALLLNLAVLPPMLMRLHHMRLVAAVLEPLLGLDRARLFRLPAPALVLVWRGESGPAVEVALSALRRLFFDLPETASLIRELELPADNAVIANAIASAVPAESGPVQRGVPLDPGTLVVLESALARADVAPYMRCRPVCSCTRDAAPVLAFEHRTLNITKLIASLAPGVQPRSDPWLFQRLTRTLDRRMMAVLTDPIELRHAAPFAFDLNVASILGPEFLRFDATLPVALRGKVILALRPADILSDTAAYEFARAFCRARAYRLMLQGVTPAWLDVLPAEDLGVDLIELRAAPDLILLPDTISPDIIVLADVVTPGALQWGHDQGISLFRGPSITPPRR